MTRGDWIEGWVLFAACIALIAFCVWVAVAYGGPDQWVAPMMTVFASVGGWFLGKIIYTMVDDYRHSIGGKR